MLTISCWFFFGCKTYKADNLPSKQLIFGSGGGISGGVKEYIILENGQIFTRNSLSNEISELPKVKKKTAKALYQEYEANLQSVECDDPGNLYYFLTMKDDTTKTHKMIWSGNGDAPALAKSFYIKCTELVKQK